jgi:hypothetical protein
VRASLDVIERITGVRPRTCPWRSYYHPLVRAVMDAWWSIESGSLAAVIGDDPPQILIDAIGLFERARKAACSEDARLRHESWKRHSSNGGKGP